MNQRQVMAVLFMVLFGFCACFMPVAAQSGSYFETIYRADDSGTSAADSDHNVNYNNDPLSDGNTR
jgi:hypothetical protein